MAAKDNAIEAGQAIAVMRLLAPFTNKDRGCGVYIISRLIGREVQSVYGMNSQEWRKFRNEAYPYWRSDNWEVAVEFKAKIAELVGQYHETVLGQKRLF